MAYTWPQVVNGVTFTQADFSPFNYATKLPDLLGNFTAYASSQQSSVQAALAATYSAEAQTARQLAQAAVASVTAGSTTALSFPAVDKVLATVADVAAVFVYDTRQDSDGGAWRFKCQHTSWWNETLNTATRGARRDFPMVALIVARSGGTVTIYDALDLDPVTGVPRMWMVASGSVLGAGTLTGAVAINGRIMWCSTTGLFHISFTRDQITAQNSGGWYRWSAPISGRASGSYATLSFGTGTPQALVSDNCNHAHARVLPGAPLDEAGLPIPTVAVATAGGVSVIHPSGAVYDITRTGGFTRVSFYSDVELAVSYSALAGFGVGPVPYGDTTDGSWVKAFYFGGSGVPRLSGDGVPVLGPRGALGQGDRLLMLAEDLVNPANGMIAYTTTAYATGYQPGDIRLATLCDGTTGAITESGELSPNPGGPFASTTGWVDSYGGTLTVTDDELDYTAPNGGVVPGPIIIIPTTPGLTYLVALEGRSKEGGAGFQVDVIGIGGSAVFSATTNTVRYLQFTATASSANIRVGISSGSSTTSDGFLLASFSVKRAVADRSYKATGLLPIGTLSRNVVATGADLVAVSGFSGSNYLEQPYNADLDFGDADFAVMGWIKEAANSSTETVVERDSATTGPRWTIQISSGGNLQFITDDDTDVVTSTSGAAIDDATWHFFVCAVRSGVQEVWIDSALSDSDSASAVGTLTNAAAITRIGATCASTPGSPLTNGSLALLRATAYAPTPAQIRRQYQDERPLFQADAKAFLGGTSDSVQDLSYDESRKLLAVGTADGASIFSGLRRVAYHDASTLTALTSDDMRSVAAGAGILLLGSAAEAGVYQDAVFGKEAVLDHGPRHAGDRFQARGVTTDATPLDLAPRVMIGERELVVIEARIIGRVYGATDSERLSYIRKGTYYRNAGGNVTLQGSVQTIGTDTEQSSGADATLQIDTTPQTVTPRVTGVAATRIVWTADITVTRHSEDQSYA